MKKNYLLTPGPTPVPNEVLLAMARPIIHHRTSQFKEVLKEVGEGLRYVLKTENDVFIFTSSGTGAMEAAVCNLLSAGDKAIVVRGGKFGERFGELCEAYKILPVYIDVEWGRPVDPRAIKKTLDENPDVKAVFATLCETSTGIVNDIEEIAGIVGKTKAVLVTDAVSGLASDNLETDKWVVDVVVAGSQKGLMIPPGLSFVSISRKAWDYIERSTSSKYYFDLKMAKKSHDKSDTPFTPAVTLIIGLQASLRLIKEEGIENILIRHKKNAEAIREAAKAMGLRLFSKERPSNAVTAVSVPEGVDGDKLVKTMRDEYGVGIAGGQAQLKGKIFRIATMGAIRQHDLIVCISCLEKVLAEVGYDFERGAGLKTLQRFF